ncbi:Low specificity L-threonine aldolase [Achromobacter deleyi]|uniref:Low specificity L-threonine aldolase n=1 Tax=Achromobacter deleyi TaxID=1353891 RepID=A0A6S6Z913_9BURK|nr:low-specificity L-threonine aldolase [Achromobacter deleyi]CAB3655947.1 Low specificity L-threonine aldolase [Achromobacter deleyi]CAB3825833.1 Low specificity L-threonine aldolase [Achromobacter deleyi]CAB3829108.1 Low specificity L-threonine aldolase [Achromobacter deleyi]CAB3860090.1 Low specificity L-threonine aldolase [Achromobacter deleyi]
MIDLRSDTVTRPTPAMLQAMTSAPLGDDVMGDDPTVNRLQQAVAERAGKAAGLFFPSGTQSNLAGLMAHCERGDEYLVGQLAHTYKYEGGGAAVLASIQPQPIEHAEDGSLPLEKLAAALKPEGDPHFARTRLLALENTFHGKLIPADYIRAATDWARSHGLGTHLDGARVFNAAVASGKPLADMCESFDSVSICFSKGLGAPVGSVLVGSAELIARARRWRKMLGGGLRQSGVLAAACLYALEHNVDRLADDHDNARQLAEGLRGIAGVRVLSQDTNMVFAQFEPARCEALTAALAADGILMRAVYGGPTRLVTHLDVSAADVRRVVEAVARHLG